MHLKAASIFKEHSNFKTKLILLFCLTCLMLVHALFWYLVSDSRAVVLVSGSLFACFILFYILISRGAEFSKLYLAALLCSGLIFSVLLTPFSVPDEDYHFAASYSWSNLLMGYGYQDEDPLVMRACDAEFYQNKSVRVDRAAFITLIDGLGQPFSEDNGLVLATTNRTHELSSNLPQEKLPSAIGITLARLLGLSPTYLFLVGRLCNAVLFSLLFYLAFKIAPFGKNAFVCVSLLPMSLHLGASYSYDSFVIPMGALLIALFLRAIYSDEGISKIEIGQLLIATVLLAPCKLIYSAIVLLAILIPVERFRSRKVWLAFACTCLLAAVFSIGLTKLGSLMAAPQNVALQSGSLDQRGEETGSFYSASDVIQHPVDTFTILLKTFDSYLFDYLRQMIGCSLGWLQSELIAPGIYAIIYFILLIISGQADLHDRLKQPARIRLLEFLIFVVVCLSVMFVMLFSWTFNTESLISGVQGRYFLPVLVLLLLSTRLPCLYFDKVLSVYLFVCILFINSIYLIRTFAVAIALC